MYKTFGASRNRNFEREFSVSGYTVLDRRNALLPGKVKMMMVLH